MHARRICTYSKIPHLWFKYNYKQRSTMFALYNKIHDCIFIPFFHISSVLHALSMFIWERNPNIGIVYFLHLFLEINKLITTVSPLLITRLLVDCVKNEDILACPLIFLHPMASLKLNINFFANIRIQYLFPALFVNELGQLSNIGLCQHQCRCDFCV